MRLFKMGTVVVAGLLVAALAAVACGGETEVVEKVVTVEVEKVVEKPGEKVVETVVVEKVVEGKTVTEVQTVVVEKEVKVTEKVVETVVVVATAGRSARPDARARTPAAGPQDRFG